MSELHVWRKNYELCPAYQFISNIYEKSEAKMAAIDVGRPIALKVVNSFYTIFPLIKFSVYKS